MNFEAAMEAVQAGEKVTRAGMVGYVFLFTPEGEGEKYVAKFSEELGETPFAPTEEDQAATDWMTVQVGGAVA